jgi:hypothetical protein
MIAFGECCVLSGRGLCEGPSTRPQESHRVWCVWVWSRNLNSEEVLASKGCRAMGKWKTLFTPILATNVFKRHNLLLLLLLLQALQIHWLKVLAFSNTSFHLTRTWMHFIPLLNFKSLKSSFISFSHIIFGLSANFVHSGFHSYNFFYHPFFCHSVYMAKRHNGAGYPPHLPSGCLFCTIYVVQFIYSMTISSLFLWSQIIKHTIPKPGTEVLCTPRMTAFEVSQRLQCCILSCSFGLSVPAPLAKV